MNRVVVTGQGIISPIGHTAPEYSSNLVEGTSGIGPITCQQAADLTQKNAAEVTNYDPLKYFNDKEVAPLDRTSQFAVITAREALTQSGLKIDEALSQRTAVIVGTGIGGQNTIDDSFRRLYKDNKPRAWPLTVPKLMPNAPASQVSMFLKLRGPAFGVVSACASATHAIGLAFQMVRAGIADVALAGGAEACITYGTMRGWEAMRVMSPDVCRPFSKDRKGMMIGEGAGMFVLETLERAKARGANILGEIVGFGMSADAGDLTAPDENGMARAITSALTDGKLAPTDVQYVNAHGTGTAANDETETKALHIAFKDHAKKLAVSSTKSMVGHALGAAGALEFTAALMAAREEIAPPTIGYVAPDPACDLDYVPNEARKMPINNAISNSFAFGGLNAVLALSKV